MNINKTSFLIGIASATIFSQGVSIIKSYISGTTSVNNNMNNNRVLTVPISSERSHIHYYNDTSSIKERDLISSNLKVLNSGQEEFQPFHRHLQDNYDYFHIKNQRLNNDNIELCIEPVNNPPTSLSSIHLQECDRNNNGQSWHVDSSGRIHPFFNNSLCIKRIKMKLQLEQCENKVGMKYAYDTFDNTIIYKKNGFNVFATVQDRGDIGTKINISLRDKKASFQQWIIQSYDPQTTSPSLSPSSPIIPEVTFVNNPCNSMFQNGLCEECTGDCDSDSDCVGTMRCMQRRGWDGSNTDNVPGCKWSETDDVDCATDTTGSIKCDNSDFCFQPVSLDGVVNYIGECGDAYKCNECEGDCDSDSDCAPGLACFMRSGYEAVPGCNGEGGLRDVWDKDICYNPNPPVEYKDSLKINENGCSSESPCDVCTGPCSTNSDCKSSLTCFNRSGGSGPVVGCVTGGAGDVSGINYCYEEPMNGPVTYIPGDLTVSQNGLMLSTGLTSRIIARTGYKVQFDVGGESTAYFHSYPDAAAVFPITSGENAGGWIYASNSESTSGGVGAITFNSAGNVINYEMILFGTVRNCGGGKTYWGTWVTCEENSSNGQVWEVNPYTGLGSGRKTVLGGTGGNYESFAYDNRDPTHPTFYVTHDSSSGGLRRFTPDPTVVATAITTGDYSSVLTTMGTLHYLVLTPNGDNPNIGTFDWTTTRSLGDSNASSNYPGSEGIDIRNGFLYFTAKSNRHLFILDLDQRTYARSSTVSGAFDGSPDQIKRILGENPDDDLLYFCEESSADNGIHARDSDGNYYSIIAGPGISSETTGLAFSPDKKRMYVSYQFNPGTIFEISREDGYAFGGMRLDIKYHYSTL